MGVGIKEGFLRRGNRVKAKGREGQSSQTEELESPGA